MRALPFLMAVLAIFLSLSYAIDTSLSIFENVAGTGSWTRENRAASSSILHLQIVLHQPRAGEFEQFATEIATPGHEQYGKHLSREQIRDFLQPSTDSIESVQHWLQDNDVPSDKYRLSKSADTINLKIAVGDAEALLKTEFYMYTNNGRSIIRSEEYSLPDALHKHITTVMPIIRFPEITPHMSMILQAENTGGTPTHTEADPDFCNNTMTPSCIRALYQMGNFSAPLNTGVTIGVSGYLDAIPMVDDLHNFIAAYAPYCPQVFPSLISTDGSPIPQPDDSPSINSMEPSLDMQYASSLAPGIPLSFYSTSGTAPTNPDDDWSPENGAVNEPYEVQLRYLLSLPDDKLPSVLSTSFGENDETVPTTYQNTTCLLFAQLGARGVSVIFSSGDEGPGSSCHQNEAHHNPIFNAIYPASCPFVTSVGGTVGINPERAAPFSSGGFGLHMLRQPWQNATVNAYFQQLGNQWGGLYQPRGRGFPDLAIQSVRFTIRDHGKDVLVSGTSAGAPVFAAMVANLNAVRISMGLPKLGFLNPWLYGEARDAFTDITIGGSTGCKGTSISGKPGHVIPYASWNATKGWDPVTGLGTPIWPKLLEYAIKDAPKTGGDQAVDDVAAAAEKDSTADSASASFIRRGPWRSNGVNAVDGHADGDGSRGRP